MSLPRVGDCYVCGDLDVIGDYTPELHLWRCRACGHTRYLKEPQSWT